MRFDIRGLIVYSSECAEPNDAIVLRLLKHIVANFENPHSLSATEQLHGKLITVVNVPAFQIYAMGFIA